MRKIMKSMLAGSAVIMMGLAQPISAAEPVCEPNGWHGWCCYVEGQPPVCS